MKIGIIGAGHIGGNIARRLALAGHEVLLSYSRDPNSLSELAGDIGANASAATPADAARGDVTVLSVPWSMIDDALTQAGSLADRIVIDTTNQFGPSGPIIWPDGRTAASHNGNRIAGSRYTKCFNALTAGFQADSAGRVGDDRVVQWLCGNDTEAKAIVAAIVNDAGYQPVDIGGTSDAAVMEAPRRPGSVYGEEYHLDDALAVVRAVQNGSPIPPTPHYGGIARSS